jgi:osmotically-inducible protein OsmY
MWPGVNFSRGNLIPSSSSVFHPFVPASWRTDILQERGKTMASKKYLSTAAAAILAITAGMVAPPQMSFAATASGAGIGWQADNEAQGKLKKSQFKDVKVSVDGGIATLTGTVSLYEYKKDAANRVRKAKGVTAVRNDIQVVGTNVPDNDLKAKLAEKLAYDRVGYGTTPFNAITVNVENGVVTLGGHAYSDVDKDSAVALVSTYPGVKDVMDDIEVDPTSIMDDQTRMAVARAIYGYPSLNKYAIDPAKPIRISVQNGHVELYGVVDSKADKDTANIRANGVPGVFSVKNYLQVAGQSGDTEKPNSPQPQ